MSGGDSMNPFAVAVLRRAGQTFCDHPPPRSAARIRSTRTGKFSCRHWWMTNCGKLQSNFAENHALCDKWRR